MRKKHFLTIVALMLIMAMFAPMLPTSAWIYPDGSSDAKFEQFGPRADVLRIHLYADDTAEFAALKAGDIDMTDWPLSKTEYEIMTSPPYDTQLNVVNYGAEYGLFILDMNSNDNQYLGNPQDPTYPNPVADRDDATGNPNIGGGAGPANNRNPMSEVSLRRAIGHLVDRDGLIADPTIGAGFGIPLYTTMPPPNAKYLLDVYGDTDMPWAWEYNPTKAIAQLEADLFKVNPDTGYRYWDRNNDDVEQPDEYVELIFYIRSDHPGRNHIGTVLTAEMTAVQLRVNAIYATSGIAFVNVMVNKDFHLYTGGWSLGVDPDHLILWSWNYYWHPGFAYNYGGHNDPEFNDAADGIMYANTQDEAVYWALLAQYRQAYMVLGIPLYATSGNKAYSKTYVGGEAPYTGAPWEGVVNMMGYGIDNGWTFLNMRPAGFESTPPNPITIRWGFKVPDMKQLNPIYSSWLYDWNAMGGIYFDSLTARNASDLGQFMPWLASGFEVGTYLHPKYGNSSKIRFTLRNDATWQDGVPITVADVYFSFVEIKQILESRGFPKPWWWSSVENILSFTILDAYNFEVLLDVKSYWALGWIGGSIILPKHIWKPICEAGDPQAFQPDPDLIGSGPWRFGEYVENSHVLLYANKPGSVVHGITSPQGYWRYCAINPLMRVVSPPELTGMAKLPMQENITMHSTLQNLFADTPVNVTTRVTIDDGIAFDSGNMTDIGIEPGKSAGLLDFHFKGRAIDWGWSTLWFVDPGPFPGFGPPELDGIVYHKRLWIHLCGYFVVTWKGEVIFKYKVNSITIQIDIWRTVWYLHNVVEAHWPRIVRIGNDLEFSWHTIKEDISGSTYYDDLANNVYGTITDDLNWTTYDPSLYPYKSQLPTPDIKVDIKDIALAAKAFGAYPGHARWSTVADINLDYIIDIKDIARIAKRFGWLPASTTLTQAAAPTDTRIYVADNSRFQKVGMELCVGTLNGELHTVAGWGAGFIDLGEPLTGSHAIGENVNGKNT